MLLLHNYTKITQTMNLHCGQQWVSNNNGKQNQNVTDRNHAVDIYKPETEEFPKLRKPGQNTPHLISPDITLHCFQLTIPTLKLDE